jgi:hypothetical protein
MKKITVKLTGENILKRAWLKNENEKSRDWAQAKELQFDAKGIAEENVEENVEYILSWTLIGTPGDAWSLEVDEPSVYVWNYYSSTSPWKTTRISIAKSLVSAGYADLRVLRINIE